MNREQDSFRFDDTFMKHRLVIPLTWILILSVGLSSSCETHTEAHATDPLDPQAVPQLSLVETARIGGEDTRPEYLLSQITSAVFLDDESIAIASGMDEEIKIFSQKGTFIRTMGHEGGGPGEFRALSSIVALSGGRLLAWDIQTVRATIFAADGGVENSVTLDLRGLDQLRPPFVGAFSDGRVVLMDSKSVIGRREEAPGLRRDTLRFVLFSQDGTRWSELISVIGPEYFFYNTGEAWGKKRLLFGRSVHSAVAGDLLLVGNSEELSVIVASPGDHLIDTLSLPRPPRPVDEDDIALEKENWVKEAEAEEEGRQRRLRGYIIRGLIEHPNLHLSLLESIPALPDLPAFSGLLGSDDGSILIGDALRPGAGTQRWFFMGKDFRPVAWFELDDADQLLAASKERILVLRRSPLDVESVHVLELRDR